MSKLFILSTAILLAACAGAGRETASTSGEGRRCFAVNDVTNWEGGTGNKVTLRTRQGDFFQAKLMSRCLGLDFSQKIALLPRTSHLICEGDDAVLIADSIADQPERCRADRFRRLSAEEVAALPPRDRP